MPGFEVVPSDLRSSFRQPIREVPMVLGKRESCRGSCSGSRIRHSNRNINTSHPLCFSGSQDLKMVSIVRPAMLRQTCFAAASKRTFSTKLSSSFPTNTKPAASILLRPVVRNTFVKDALPCAVRVAAFHASGRRAILPPLPRKLKLQSHYYLES